MAESFFGDEHFQDALTALLCRDTKALRDCASLLDPNDFKPVKGMRWGRPRWIIAERALEHYQKYHEPIGALLGADVLDYANSINLGERAVAELKEYCTRLAAVKLVTPDAVTGKVIRFKRDKLKALAVQEMVEAQSVGMLTDEKWHEIHNRVMNGHHTSTETYNYLEHIGDRIERRKQGDARIRTPWTFIDPLDALVRCVGPNQLGLLIAPYKRGKSLMLLWLAVAYVLQRLNVLYLTLEDPLQDAEDRLDSIVTAIPIKSLTEYPDLLRRRFERFRGLVRRQLKIFDGTGGGVTVARIEQIIMQERERGFMADAVIIDYDDEIAPVTKQKERRFEFADIYRDLRQMIARLGLIGWIAAQTQRDTESLKILSGDRVAEDISKLRKVTMAISMGKGDPDWGSDAIYLWIAAHKFDMQHVGCHIVPCLDRMLIFDREATERETRRHNRP
jgi:hypothetical protein